MLKNITKPELRKYLNDDVISIVIGYLQGYDFWDSLRLGYVELVVNRLILFPSDICLIEIAATRANQNAILEEVLKRKKDKFCKTCLAYSMRTSNKTSVIK